MYRRFAPLIVGSLLIFGVVAYVTLYRASPGPLAAPHAAVAGSPLITDCSKCHAPKGLASGCLHCHTEIQDQLNRQAGYHSYLLKDKPLECGHCHAEHNGASFELINSVSWAGTDKKTFTHPETTFQLKDAHIQLVCEKCHNSKLQPPFNLPKFPKWRRAHSFLGLRQACVSCHADPHEGGKLTQCTACHNQVHWRPAPLFNHDKFYPLRGPHTRLACSQCHMPSAGTRTALTRAAVGFGRTKGKRCIDCHGSPHRTTWAESCETCHTATDTKWSAADQRMTRTQHAETVFKIVPPHLQVKCAQCHAPAASFKQKFPDPKSAGYNRLPQDCEGCHRDEHRGQFKSRYAKCLECHSLQGWKPSKFDSQRHQNTSYPLVGGHSKADCNACHTMNSSLRTRRYAGIPTACETCHRDIHYGQFRKGGTTHCEDCHRSPVKWSILVFNHEIQSKFKLGKAHQNVSCKACHPVVSLRTGIKLVQYKPIKTECSDCHGFNTPAEK